MATSLDSFDDLEDLVDSSDDSLTENFNNAANHLKNLVDTLESQTLLTLYGYYKQGIEGPCDTPKPSWYDMKAKSKWEAWSKLGTMSQVEAKTLYVDLVSKLDPSFNPKSQSQGQQQKGESWVTVSIFQNEDKKLDFDKTIADYVKEGNCGEIERLLNGTDINHIDENGLGLIHWAADRGALEILKLLVESGADVDLLDSEGQTALHYAASCGHLHCVKLLLANNANKGVLDNDGTHPYEVASDDHIKELLLK